MKKILLMLFTLILLAGCSAETSFDDYMLEFIESSETLETLEEVLTVIEFDDARIGLSLIKDKEQNVILYLGQMMIDESTNFVFSHHGETIPLSYYDTNNERIWTLYNLENNIFLSEEDETPNYKYVYGVSNKINQKLVYENGTVKQKDMEFEYLKDKVNITLWVVQLEKDKNFDISKLLNLHS